MFKKLLIAITFTIASVINAQAADLKIGIVDTKVVLSKAPQLKVANEKIQKQFKEQQSQLVKLQKKGEKLKEKATKEKMTMTLAQKIELDRELQSLDAEFNLKKKFLQEDLKMSSSEEQKKVLAKINKAIEQIAKKEKFDLILARDVVVIATPALDITDKVVAIISKP